MSARRVPSGMRPSRSHSRRPISEPPRRPATAIRTPFAPAFIDRWIVTVTWLMPRSISTPDTLAFARRRSTSWRMPMSSLRRDVYSLSAYHFAVQVRETPSRKPYGWTFLPISGLPVRDDDRDVSHGLVDRERPTLRPWLEALDRGALVGNGIE